MKSYRLSKSRLMDYLQCPKKLYLRTHHPDLLQDSAQAEKNFSIGYQVGEVAQQLYPDGVLIGHDTNLALALAETQEVLKAYPDHPVFEATFQHGGILVRADIMLPTPYGYRMLEVKASASVKEQHLPDCAVQSWVVSGAGINLASVALSHIDSKFVYQGDGQYHGLFQDEDVTDRIADFRGEVPRWVDACQSLLSGDMPDIAVGSHCNSPYECPFINHCAPNRNEGYPVSALPRAGKLARELVAEGYADIRDIPEGRLSKENHERVRRITASGQAELDEAAKEVMQSFSYPRYYLDFETIAFAVPIWAMTRPYEAIPFQWSCHIEESPGQIRHEECLDISGGNPALGFINALLITLGEKGPIFVYSSYEKTILGKLCARFPELTPGINLIIGRLVDLLPITEKHYYHPEMKGSWSIKKVLPTLASDISYQEVGEVQDGMMAQQAYLELIAPATPIERKALLKRDLLAYCELDTLAMIRLAHFLDGKPADVPETVK